MTTDKTENSNTQFHPHKIEWDDEKIQRLWDFYGSSTAMDTVYFGATVGKHVARTIRRLGLFNKPASIIDFSCGKGHLIEHCSTYLKTTTTIIGYDPSEKSIREANIRNKNSSNFGGAFQLSTFPTKVDSKSTDLILLTEVIEHLDDDHLDTILEECFRILKSGGSIFITTPNNEQLDRENTMCPECGCCFHRWQHVRYWTPSHLEKVLSEHGFKDVKAKTITWGNELIDLAFSVIRRKKTGIYVTAKT